MPLQVIEFFKGQEFGLRLMVETNEVLAKKGFGSLTWFYPKYELSEGGSEWVEVEHTVLTRWGVDLHYQLLLVLTKDAPPADTEFLSVGERKLLAFIVFRPRRHEEP